MDAKKLFKNCMGLDNFNEDGLKLLKKIMEISSPMKFDAEFATNEELDILEQELDRFNIFSDKTREILNAVNRTKPYITNIITFI